MGEGYLFRKRFEEAQAVLHAQNDWCDAAQHIRLLNEARHESADKNTVVTDISLNARFPDDLRNEALVALLRGDVKLNVHCYETHDIEAMVRHSLEFNFTIAAFHHALDAYRIPAILRRAHGDVTIATFADNWGYKKEAFQGSPFGPKILIDAGINVALKSDHPVLNSVGLHAGLECTILLSPTFIRAAKSAYYGLTPQQAFSTVSSVPARTMGLGHRIGTLAPGYDADVVIWDRNPLDLGAYPLQVFIDGVPQLEEKEIVAVPEKKMNEKTTVKVLREPEGEEEGSFVLRNVGKVFMKKGESVVAEERSKGEMVIRVEGGKVICIGDESCAGGAKGAAYDVQGGYVLPGLVAVGSSLGLVEIIAEPSTTDGFVLASASTDPRDLVRAVDGLKFGTRHLEEAYKAGVLIAVTAPLSESVVAGESVAFKTGSESILDDRTLISSQAALHLQFGDLHKNHITPTISSQLAFLRRLLQDRTNSTSPDDTYAAAARGDIPVVISANNADEIASLIRLKRELEGRPDIVILGGAEAHLVAPHLAAARIPVILSPALCTPSTYATQRCLPGLPLSNFTAIHVLHQAGVLVGLGVSDDGIARNLAWDAGLAYQSSQGLISESDAVAFVTYNLEKIFNLKKAQGFESLSVGADADFVVYSGSPFEMSSRVLMVNGGGKGVRILA
ncbi:hypothetical protein BC937DRAFT_93740 [Endogone sp. FLAS-F59071]|nr:hypothetical protein BC937DRAFT_93740 [Endogone sp. FLAS-F59071]|eukprot:RUS14491.1 hypothetical protein BC937DRAFT_93740 [Endogone sp. FLAS-F59071]